MCINKEAPVNDWQSDINNKSSSESGSAEQYNKPAKSRFNVLPLSQSDDNP